MLFCSPAFFAGLFDFGGTEILLIMVVILVFFGGEKLPEFARGFGKAIREFKKATAGIEEEFKRAMEEPPKPAAKARPFKEPAKALPANPATTPPVQPETPTPEPPKGEHGEN